MTPSLTSFAADALRHIDDPEAIRLRLGALLAYDGWLAPEHEHPPALRRLADPPRRRARDSGLRSRVGCRAPDGPRSRILDRVSRRRPRACSAFLVELVGSRAGGAPCRGRGGLADPLVCARGRRPC